MFGKLMFLDIKFNTLLLRVSHNVISYMIASYLSEDRLPDGETKVTILRDIIVDCQLINFSK